VLVELEIVFCIGRTYRGLDLFSSGVVLLAQLFSSSPLDQQRFQVLAQPLREGGWKLLVLEQLKPSPACWRVRSDGLVSPSLVRFDFSGICNRYIDSNGYSLRINQKDLATSHSLQLVQEGRNLLLLGVPQATGSALVVASAAINNKVGNDGFLALQLAPGWQLSRRTYNGQGLSHIYFSTTKTSSSPPPPPITPRVDTPRGVVPIRVIPYRPMQ
jgi:hypothetical protein